MDAILRVLNTGAPWRDLPAALGPWATAWDLFDAWNGDGTLAAALQRLQGRVEINGGLWCIDGTTVRAHKCASGGGKKEGPGEPADHALGRSRGGLSCKIHVLCDGAGHPLHLVLTPGQTHEAAAFDTLMVGADEHPLDADGEPVVWPVARAGDKGYRAQWIDDYLLELGIHPAIPSKDNQDRGERPVAFDRRAYRDSNIVERLIGWPKECRRVFSRYEKTAKNFAGIIRLAFIQRYLRLVTR